MSFEWMEERRVLAIFVVNSTLDTIALDGQLTLREAITAANTNAASGDAGPGSIGLDTVQFNILGAGVHTISPSTPLPIITDPINIDGYSQPGANPNTLTVGNDAVLLVEVTGVAAASGPALQFDSGSDGSSLRGLIINRWDDGSNYTLLALSDATTIAGNFIGTNALGTATYDDDAPILIGATGVVIGGPNPADRNVISGGTSAFHTGAVVSGIDAVIRNNYFGTNAQGDTILGSYGGLDINGANAIVRDNLISGSNQQGITLRLGGSATIIGNLIGTDATGTQPLPNSQGIGVFSTSIATIGDGTVAGRNVISGNLFDGISIDSGVVGTTIKGNYIGTNANGDAPIPNGTSFANSAGIHLSANLFGGAQGVVIGGTSNGDRNVISGNASNGIYVSGNSFVSSDNIIVGNYIGVTEDGLSPLGNLSNGILIDGSSTNTRIGGFTLSERNVVSGNDASGIHISGNATTSNIVFGNYIGLGSDGATVLGNSNGVLISDSPGNFIGSGVAGAGNVISGNDGDVAVTGSQAAGNRIQGNRISLSADGLSLIAPSFGYGVYVANGAVDTVIGTFTDNVNDATEGNLIGMASTAAVFLQDAGAAPNRTVIAGNRIGLDATGALLSAGGRGIWIQGATNTRVGTDANGTNDDLEQNVIVPSANSATGILLTGGSLGATTGTTIRGNFIGIDTTGENALSNNTNTGILLSAALGNGISSTLIGGTVTSAKNVIGALGNGIELNGALVNGNTIAGNHVGVDVTGVDALGNVNGIVFSGAASNNTVGGTTTSARNVVSGNTSSGVFITGAGTTGNFVIGNIIGTNTSDSTTLGNGIYGVLIDGANNNTIGGNSTAARNIISGNTGWGVWITGGTQGTQVQGNWIGTDSTGNAILPNDGGVYINGSSNNFIGGGNANEGNLISGNIGSGVYVSQASSVNNRILGNTIGLDSLQSVDLGNGDAGVSIVNAANTIVGGIGNSRNLISGNLYGLSMVLATGTQVRGNWIGLDGTGDIAIGNSINGVLVDGSNNNHIGGVIAGEGNVISGNGNSGILVTGALSAGNVIRGNIVGLNADGTAPVGNINSGIVVYQAASGNIIGGGALGAGNVISGNLAGSNSGAGIFNADTSGTIIQGNYIGLNLAGNAAIGNQHHGIITSGGPAVIGTDSDGNNDATEGNVIAGNGLSGIALGGSSNHTESVIIAGNKIGTNAAGSAALGGHNIAGIHFNPNGGINIRFARIGSDANNTSDTEERNIISGNLGDGILITGATSTLNTIAGNYIGVDTSGTLALGNKRGVVINAAASSNTVGGTNDDARNVISGNANNAVVFEGIGTTLNSLAGNYIGLGSDGDTVIANSYSPTAGVAVGIDFGATNNTIGGSVAGAGNVISGNDQGGIGIFDLASSGNRIQGNLVGTDATGTQNRGNAQYGIAVEFASGTEIGGPGLSRNVVSGNEDGGIGVYQANGTIVRNNYAGTDITGTAPISNGGSGIYLLDATNSLISDGNVASGNVGSGIQIEGPLATGNVVIGNFVGTNSVNANGLGNAIGILNSGDATNNTIGGTTLADRNIISGNTGKGLRILAGAITVEQNLIGVQSNGSTPLANGTGAIEVAAGARLMGSGTFNGLVTNLGTVAPGNSPGIITIHGNYSQSASATLEIEIQGTNPVIPDFDQLVVNGAVSLAGTLQIAYLSGYVAPNGSSFVVIQNDGVDAISGTFTGLAQGATFTVGTTTFSISYTGGDGNDVELTSVGQTYFVTTTADSGAGSLRQAILDANAIGGADRILFNIAGGGVQTISPLTSLPIIAEAVTIDGYSQAGSSVNTLLVGNNAVLNIQISGSLINGSEASPAAFTITSSGSVIRGLILNSWSSGTGFIRAIALEGAGATGNIIEGNFIGTNASGTGIATSANKYGIRSNGASANTIGGATPAARNIISANERGIELGNDTNSTIAGNYIGTDITGQVDLGNTFDGVRIYASSRFTTIGGTTPAARNVISGNDDYGVLIANAGTTGNTVLGNYIGTTASGLSALGNGSDGVNIQSSASGNTIGGTAAGAGNVIAGNAADGIFVLANSTSIFGNMIGLGSDGDTILGNNTYGIRVIGVTGTLIGAGTASSRNVISGSGAGGILLAAGTANTLIRSNYIGTDHSGTIDRSTHNVGILVDASAGTGNIIGGTVAGHGNVVSGANGPNINFLGASSGLVQGNILGLASDGNLLLGAGIQSGIGIRNGASNILIGGSAPGARNVISGNQGSNAVGIEIFNLATGITIQGNYIGTGVDGIADRGNTTGIYIHAGANNVTIGGDDSADGTLDGNINARNVISGNDLFGVYLENVNNNVIRGNYIGVDRTGNAVLANSGRGIFVQGLNNTVGGSTAGAGNVISGNATGVEINGAVTSGSTVAGNFIGTNAAGTAAIPNSTGVLIVTGASNNTIGGSTSFARNLISGNTSYGVEVASAGSGNKIQGNFIGTDWTGTGAIGNASVQPAGAAVRVSAMAGNTVHVGTEGDGSNDAGEGNLISGNFGHGVRIQGGNNDTGSHVVAGNLIGVDVNGALALPNQNDAILILTSRNNRIGTNGDGTSDDLEANVISGNRNLGGNPSGPGIVPVGIRIVDSITSDSLLAADNTIAGNIIGLNAQGTGSLGNQGSGLVILDGSSNAIGGSSESQRNVISGNGVSGIEFAGSLTTGNSIVGNWIGLGVDGDTMFGNALNGLQLLGGSGTIVGGFATTPGTGLGNVISGNGSTGIFINGSNNEFVRGNIIGLDSTGTRDRGNAGAGIAMANGTPHLIGGDDDDDGSLDGVVQARNVISGNSGSGIGLSGGPQNVTIQGNYVGTNIAGTVAIANGAGGILVASSYNVLVGGTTPGAGNLVSGNAGVGISTVQQNLPLQTVSIQGNLVGTDHSGAFAIPNSVGGISTNNLLPNSVNIGGSASSARNLISGNSGYGLRIIGSTVVAEGNFIGTDIAGISDLGNAGVGLFINGSSTNTIRNNTISGNNGGGVRLDVGSTANSLTQNSIGTSANGILALPNGTLSSPTFGIELDGASGNAIGGSSLNRNVISGNRGTAVVLKTGASSNAITFNWIGANAIDSAALGNSGHAIHMIGATSVNNALENNLLYYNGGSALRLEDTTSTTASGNTFNGNGYRNNLGQTVDIGSAGPTDNDGLDLNLSNLRDYPVITSASIVGDQLEIVGLSQPNRRIDFHISSVALNGRGQAVEQIAVNLLEGSATDLDATTGTYGAPHATSTVNANNFRFRLPLTSNVRFGTLITGVTVGSISEFSNVVPVGLTTADLANNLAPVVTVPSNASLATGETLQVDGGYRDDDSTDWTATVDYGDGAGEQALVLDKVARTFSLNHPYKSNGTYTVTVRVKDNGGKTGTASLSLIVQNEAPTLSYNQFTITSKVTEGGIVTLDGLFTDTGITDHHVVTIDWGDGSIVASNVANPDIAPIPPGSQSFRATHRYIDDGASNTPRDSYRVQVTVTDNGNLSDTSPDGLFVIEVLNVQPSNIAVSLPPSIQENDLVTLNGTFIDPGVLDGHTVKVNWGDGTSSTLPITPVGQRTFALAHTYKNNPIAPASDYEIIIEVGDDDEPLLPSVLKKRIAVANALPSISSSNIVLSQSNIDENGTISLSASFTDPGSIDKHQVVIDWGDGSEPKSIDLAAGVQSITGIVHQYLDDPTGMAPNTYTIAVKVRDKDMPANDFVTATTSVTVSNLSPSFVVPTVGPILRFTSDGLPVTGTLIEGARVTVTGQYTDPGTLDVPVVTVSWGDGTTSLAYVSSSTHTFTATHVFRDDNEANNGLITATIDDQDGGTAITTATLRVNNAAPTARIAPSASSNSSIVLLDALTEDLGIDDVSTLVYQWTIVQVGSGPAPIVSGLSTPSLSVNRNGNLTAEYRVTLMVTDDEGGSVSIATHLILLDDNPNSFAPPLSAQPTAVNSVTIMGFAGADTLDLRAWTIPVVLDGGADADTLFGGSADDTLILHQGNDLGYGGGGNDRYVMTFNSILTVEDYDGANVLDFSPTTFGVTFDLNLAVTSTTDVQDVLPVIGQAPLHKANINGQFETLIGTRHSDTITGTSGALIDGGRGNDKMSTPSGLSSLLRFRGGADDDLLTIEVDSIVSEVSFEGDFGADEFIVLGEVTTIDFGGGADDDVLTIEVDSIVNEVSFEGDFGADEFIVLGEVTTIDFGGGADDDVLTIEVDSIVNEISFEGDFGADEFIVLGEVTMIDFGGGADDDVLTIDFGSFVTEVSFEGDMGADEFIVLGEAFSIDFGGGADDDVLTIDLNSFVTEISFEGDMGADEFIVLGEATTIYFSGGADDDLLTIGVDSIVNAISFEGDFGADEFIVLGDVTTIDFGGGADDDVLTIEVDSVVNEISFEGDFGADEFYLLGEATTRVDFDGGADSDLLVLETDSIVNEVSFEGDFGADEFYVLGEVSNSVEFGGGADDDLLVIGIESIIYEVSFEGDFGADEFYINGEVTQTVDFNGGADDDLLLLSVDSVVNGVSFEGDFGADDFYVYGEVTSTVDFNGGADDDLLVLGVDSVVNEISFEGDFGADEFYVFGEVATIDFEGGADDDLLLLAIDSIVQEVSFEGDSGADEFQISGTVTDTVDFSGGADGDRLINRSSGVDAITFYGFVAPTTTGVGIDGADLFVNSGSQIGTIRFWGNLDDDVLYSFGSSIDEISFEGDIGADVFIIDGVTIGSVDFEGGADDDVLSLTGSEIFEVSFEGDDSFGDGSDDGDDTLVNRAQGATVTNQPSTIFFRGLGGIDAFRNDGYNWDSIVFLGGDQNDALQNNADGLTQILFQGEAGNDVFENNGSQGSGFLFVGDQGNDIFVNDGRAVSDLIFLGGADHDLLLNTGNELHTVSFEGDAGNDTLVNFGASVSGVHFEGNTGNDRWLNSGMSLTNANFWGGAGDDGFMNRSTGVQSSAIRFHSGSRFDGVTPVISLPIYAGNGANPLSIPADTVAPSDDGVDRLINFADQVAGIFFYGGPQDDVFQNSGFEASSVEFQGEAGNDTALNLGARLRGFTMLGGLGKDAFENRGNESTDLIVDGGDGDDTLIQRGTNVAKSNLLNVNQAAVTLIGGAGIDVLANFGSGTLSLKMEGGTENDRLLNNADNVQLVWFLGGAGNDALQNNGRGVDEIRMSGDGDEDSLFNNGFSIRMIDFDGGTGSDTLINTGSLIGDSLASPTTETGIRFIGGGGSDLLRAQGSGLARVYFDSGDGNDSLLYNGSGNSIQYLAGLGDDVFSHRGSASNIAYQGNAGDDRAIYSGIAPNPASGMPTVVLDGGIGDDRFEFASTPKGYVLIVDDFAGALDTSRDLLDFSTFTSGDVSIDLASLGRQFQPGDLSIQLSSANGIELVVGSSGGDTISGNDRDNYIGGAQYFYQPAVTAPVAERVQTQWVFLDFDSYTNNSSEGNIGEHVYTPDERTAIQRRIEGVYYGYESDGSTPRAYASPSRWFNVQFTQNLSDITNLGVTQYVTIKFNETPASGRPGGEASEIDLGNEFYGGTAKVQVNGLLGGIEVPVPASEDFMEQLPEDSEQSVGQDKPPATSENFVALSAKIAAHELAHLLGLRHYDAFGPIGFGVHSPPGVAEFKPQYQGSSAAFETFDHIIGSPASVGSARANDVGVLFFGEREAVKIAVSNSDASKLLFNESELQTVSVALPSGTAAAKVLKQAIIQVPNTLARGINSVKSFFVQAASVSGAIGIQGLVSESDYYVFNGQGGDLVTIEIASRSMRRFTDNGMDGYIDSVVRLRDESGNLVQAFNADAVNDDEFESSDSLLMDIRLPHTGVYTIEVDTFHRSPTDVGYNELVLAIDELQLLEALTEEQQDRLDRLRDSQTDTDVGNYQLFLYSFAPANRMDGVDDLKGRGGVDVIDGGPNDSYGLTLGVLPSGLTGVSGSPVAATIGFNDRGGSSWIASINFGDTQTFSSNSFTPETGLILEHVYATSGQYDVYITLTNDDGQQVVGSFTVSIEAGVPTAMISQSVTIAEGGSTIVSLTPNIGVNPVGLRYYFSTSESQRNLVNYAGSGFVNSQIFTFQDDEDVVVYARVIAANGAYSDYQTTITVNNVAPTVIINAPTTSPEGMTITMNLTGADASIVDAQSLRYIMSTSQSTRNSAVYGTSGTATTQNFRFTDNGSFTIYVRVMDKDGGQRDYSHVVAVTNVNPTATISPTQSIVEGGKAIVALSGASDVTNLETSSLRFYFSLHPLPTPSVTWANGSTTNFQEFVFGDNGAFSVNARVMDKDGGFTDYQALVNVSNVAPTPAIVSISDPVRTGLAVQMVGSATDPALANDTTNYAWSVYLGNSPTSSFAGSGQNFSFTPSIAEMYRIRLIASDEDGGSSFVESTMGIGTASNSRPSLSFTAPAESLFLGPTSVQLTATDPDLADQSGVFTYTVDWGDGTTTATGGSTQTLSRNYATVSPTGAFSISATATDARGLTSPPVTRSLIVTGWAIVPDPLVVGQRTLVVVGSESTDTIEVRDQVGDFVNVRINNRTDTVRFQGTPAGTVTRILVFGHAGNDVITLASNVTINAQIWGGYGDDQIRGGSGHDVIFGDVGNDLLFGGEGRDILIGGLGGDQISGEGNEDILIAGYTQYDSSYAHNGPLSFAERRLAIESLMAEWSSSLNHAQRRANLLSTPVNSTWNNRKNGLAFLKSNIAGSANNTVFDDFNADSLTGGEGVDWFFGNISAETGTILDILSDRSNSENQQDSDRW